MSFQELEIPLYEKRFFKMLYNDLTRILKRYSNTLEKIEAFRQKHSSPIGTTALILKLVQQHTYIYEKLKQIEIGCLKTAKKHRRK